MNKDEYYIRALNSSACLKREWVNSVFSLVADGKDSEVFDYKLKRLDDIPYYFFHDLENNTIQPIHGSDKNEPLFNFNDEITISSSDIKNHKGPPITTTYGRLLVNQLSLVLPFGDVFPFVNGPFNIKDIEQKISLLLVDDTDEIPPGKISVSQYLTFCSNTLSLSGYNHLCVTSVSRKSLLRHPKAIEHRQRLVKENSDTLSNPVTVAKIGDELEALDREWLKGDTTENYYRVKDKKLIGMVRKKMYYHFGGESPFQEGTKVEYIEKSLEEGIDVEHLPAMVNSLRYGSYNRGKQTQLGGESTKTIYRMLGTIRIVEEDCGTTLGIPMTINKVNKNQFIGVGIIEDNKTVILDNSNIGNYIDKKPTVRGPLTCNSAGRNLCAVCIGKQFSEQPEGLAAAAAGIGGRFLSLFLASFHVKALSTVRWNPEKTMG